MIVWMRRSSLAIAAGIVFATLAHADVKLPNIFGDHMVLQRQMKIPVWGKADPGEKVTVKIAGQEKTATADDKGKWRVVFDAIEATDALEMTVSGKNTVTFKDVLIGEVWLCSGQSNMSFYLKSAANGEEAVKDSNRPKLRLFTVDRIIPNQPVDEMKGEWKVSSPETTPQFSAVGYFFGQQLQEKLNQPIGLINSSWGGTRAEAWIPRETFDALKLPYEPAWTEQWLHPKTEPGKKPQPERPHEAPAVLYNGMIAPFAGFAMRGVIWYQGETNTAYGEHYRKVLSALIKSWREKWGEGDFPFLIVQLANLKNSRFWPTLREAQAQVAHDLPNVGLAVTIDIGNPDNIHPRDKLTVGKRLAASALKIAYGQDVPYSGPTFKSMEIKGNKAIIHFDHTDGGLKAKGDEMKGFQIAGADGKSVPANAKIEGNDVIVSAEGVSEPKTVRYGWENNPTCTLYNGADLPAVPFDTSVKD
jgi:sialate O-acetylesterase